jgi:hypothetical protein
MPREDLEALARLYIPDAKSFVVTPRYNPPSIRTQDEAFNRIGMPLEDSETRAGVHIPEAKGIVTAT